MIPMENDKIIEIKLGQFLKYEGIAESGVHAKILIQSGMVSVNGEVETRRGRKLHPGDEVQVEGFGAVKV